MYDDPIKDLIHLYEDGALNRRDVVSKLAKYTGSIAASLAALESVGLAQAPAAVCPAGTNVAESDPAIYAESLTIYGNAGSLYVYQARPTPITSDRRPMAQVIHENQGLTPYIKDVTRRLAKAG